MYLDADPSKTWVIDIETDGLHPSRVWCIVVKNYGDKNVKQWTVDDIGLFNNFVRSVPDAIWVGHNALSFDIPQLNRLLGTSIPLSSVIDTLVLSYLYYPAIEGGHSLDAYGTRFGLNKLSHDEWDKYSPEMLERCRRDVDITERVYTNLVKKLKEIGYSEKSCQIEHDIRRIVDQQQRNGFYFDIDGAEKLLSSLRAKQEALGGTIRDLFPPRLEKLAEYPYRVTKDGVPFKSFERHSQKYPKLVRVGENYEVYDWKEFNLGSPQQRLQKLLELGWKPSRFTDKGNPKVDEISLLEAAETLQTPEFKALADWLVLQGRISMLKGSEERGTKGWLDYVDPVTGCIHGKVFTCGAGTRRMTHNSPNTANIPKAKPKVAYGKEMRSLWTARPGRVLVGYDAAGLEMRMMCHYINNPETTELYLTGKPHDRNRDSLVIDSVDVAKNLFYAFIYGAQDERLGETAEGKPRSFGKFVRETFLKITPGLQDCIEGITSEWASDSRGLIQTIDGGYVRCPTRHGAVNYKFQSAGGIVMKVASIILDRKIKERGLDVLKVCDVHDEAQLDVADRDAEETGKLAVQSIREAGEELNFKLPLDGNYLIGNNWSETH